MIIFYYSELFIPAALDIAQTTPENAENIAIKNGLNFYCNTEDENGNIYKLFSNYDPAIETTETIAFLIK